MSKAELRIEIENPQLYTTGDTVRGQVQLTVPDLLDLEYLDVELFGMAKSKNHTYVNGQYYTGTEKHKLLQLTLRVFPPPDVQESLSSKKFTLTVGTYTYPFAFTFPDKQHTAQCVQDKKTFHSKYYLKKEMREQLALAGSFFHQEENNKDDYCMVYYSVDAKISTPIFHFNIKDSVPIYFMPKNSEIFYSLLHLCDKKRNLLEDSDRTYQKIKFGIDDDMRMKKSALHRFFSPNSVKVPFELQVNFKNVSPLDTEKGSTNRVLEGGRRLSSIIDLNLSTSFSHDNLLDVLGGNKKKGSVGAPVVRITHIKVKVNQLLRYLGATERRLEQKFEILNQDLDVEVPLSDFERTDDSESELFERSPSKFQEKVDKRVSYRLNLDPSWWDCYVNDIGQSFLTCGMRKNVSLYIRVTLASKDNPEKIFKIKSTSPVIFHSQERSQGHEPQLGGDGAENLPEYMPAPPEYEEDDDKEDEKKKKGFSLKSRKS